MEQIRIDKKVIIKEVFTSFYTSEDAVKIEESVSDYNYYTEEQLLNILDIKKIFRKENDLVFKFNLKTELPYQVVEEYVKEDIDWRIYEYPDDYVPKLFLVNTKKVYPFWFTSCIEEALYNYYQNNYVNKITYWDGSFLLDFDKGEMIMDYMDYSNLFRNNEKIIKKVIDKK